MNDLRKSLSNLRSALGGPKGTRAMPIIPSGPTADGNPVAHVWVYPTRVRGLVIHRDFLGVGTDGPILGDRWSLTHEHSSHSLARGFRTKAQAMECAERVAKVVPDIDFERPLEDMIEGYVSEDETLVPSLISRGNLLSPIFREYNTYSR